MLGFIRQETVPVYLSHPFLPDSLLSAVFTPFCSLPNLFPASRLYAPARSCLKNPRDRGAWWAAIYGIAQSQTRLKRLSSSSSILSNWASLVAQRLKSLPAMQETGFDTWVRKIPWRRKWQPTPVFLPRKSHGQRSLVGYGP